MVNNIKGFLKTKSITTLTLQFVISTTMLEGNSTQRPIRRMSMLFMVVPRITRNDCIYLSTICFDLMVSSCSMSIIFT